MNKIINLELVQQNSDSIFDIDKDNPCTIGFSKKLSYNLYPKDIFPKSKFKIEILNYFADNFDFDKKYCHVYIKLSITKIGKKNNKTNIIYINLGKYHNFLGLYEYSCHHYIDHLYLQGKDILMSLDNEIQNQITDVFKHQNDL